MKKLIIPAMLIILSASVVLAGGIRGIVKEDSKPVQGVMVVVSVNDSTFYSGITDKYGSYRFYIPATGKFELHAIVDTIKTNSIPVRIYKDTKHQNLILSRKGKEILLRGE